MKEGVKKVLHCLGLFEEVGTMLDEIAAELPQEFYKDLNGSIILLPEVKLTQWAEKMIFISWGSIACGYFVL